MPLTEEQLAEIREKVAFYSEEAWGQNWEDDSPGTMCVWCGGHRHDGHDAGCMVSYLQDLAEHITHINEELALPDSSAKASQETTEVLELAMDLQRKADAATPDPWVEMRRVDQHYGERGYCQVIAHPIEGFHEMNVVKVCHQDWPLSAEDTDFIIAARTDVPTLADAVVGLVTDNAGLTKEVAALREEVKKLQMDLWHRSETRLG